MLEASSIDVLNKSVDAQERSLGLGLPAIAAGQMSTLQKLQLHQSLESKPAQFLRDMDRLRAGDRVPGSVVVKNSSLPGVYGGAPAILEYGDSNSRDQRGKSGNSHMTSSGDTEKYHRDTFEQIDTEKSFRAPPADR